MFIITDCAHGNLWGYPEITARLPWIPNHIAKVAPKVDRSEPDRSVIVRTKLLLNSGAVGKAYIKRNPNTVHLTPLDAKQAAMTSSELPPPSDAFPKLPSTFIKAGNMSIADKRAVIRVYNNAIAKLSSSELPRVQFKVTGDKSARTGLSKHKASLRPWKSRPIFTEGLSSHSKKHDPVFYIKSSSVVSSNLPHGVHYSRDKSKIVLQRQTKADKQQRDAVTSSAAVATDGALKSVSRLSHADRTTPRAAYGVTKNHTMLLPKVHIEKGISIIDYVRSGLNASKDPVQFIPLVQPEENEIKAVTQANTSKPLGEELPKIAEDPAPGLEREQSTLTSVSARSKSRAELGSRRGARLPAEDIHKVSLGEGVELAYARSYGRQSAAAAPASEFALERQKSFESRAALSTPGRGKGRRGNVRSIGVDDRPFDSKSVPNFGYKNYKSKVVAWDNQRLDVDAHSETDDVMGESYDSSRKPIKSNVIKKYTIGDPLKDTNMQDKKLDKSRLVDLYSRGVVRDHVTNSIPDHSRVTVQMLKRDDRKGKFGGSHACGLSTIPGNPPPSIATYLATPHDASSKSHHPLLSPDVTQVSHGLLIEGSNLTMSPENKSTKLKGRVLIDGNVLDKAEGKDAVVEALNLERSNSFHKHSLQT